MSPLVNVAIECAFWAAAALVLYSYVGYPLALALLSRLLGRPLDACVALPARAPVHDPIFCVSLLIPAHNEAAVIAQKIDNSLALDYPKDKLQIRVISDGSDDGTDEIVQPYASSGLVEFQRVEPRGGKPSAINKAVGHARGEILLLCDANTMFAPDAVRTLARHFVHYDVGAVTGDVRLQSSHVSYGQGEGLFSRLERFTLRCEGKIGSCIGVDGGMYALRRELYVPNRSDTLIDDFVTAMNVAIAGRRVIFDPDARAVEDAVVDARQEFRRRTRTAAGGLQSLFEGLGRPRWNQPGLWAGYLSHKVLRWLGPWLMATMMLANAALLVDALASPGASNGRWPLWGALAAAQAVFYLAAFCGALWRSSPLPRPLALPYYFCLGNIAAAVGLFKWLLGRQSVTWAKADRSAVATVPDGITNGDQRESLEHDQHLHAGEQSRV